MSTTPSLPAPDALRQAANRLLHECGLTLHDDSTEPSFAADVRLVARAVASLPLQEPLTTALNAGAMEAFDARWRYFGNHLSRVPDWDIEQRRAWFLDGWAHALAAPSLPAVLTDATCRDALAELVACDGLLRAYIMTGKKPLDYNERCNAAVEAARRALATSATPVLP